MSATVGPVLNHHSVDQSRHATEMEWDVWWRGVKTTLQKPNRPRFTLDKARKFIAYTDHTSIGRHLLVTILSPCPGLVVSLITPLVSLQEPSRGVTKNTGFLLHFIVTFGFCMFGATLQARSMCEIRHLDYPTHLVATVAILGTLLLLGFDVLLGSVWQFPVPFMWVLNAMPWTVCLITSHALVLHRRLPRAQYIRHRFLMYLQSLSVQVSQVVIYAGYTAAFEATTTRNQILLLLAFPLLKFAIKRQIRAFSHQLGDHSYEVGVYNVEVCVSIYQAVIMQSSPSPATTAILIASDVLQGLWEMRHFREHRSPVSTAEMLATATRFLQTSDPHETKDDELHDAEASERAARGCRERIRRWCSRHSHHIVHVVTTRPIHNRTKSQQLLLAKALECWQTAESFCTLNTSKLSCPF